MPPPISPEQLRICQEIHEQVHDLVARQAAGRSSPREFVEALLGFEKERAAAHHLTLTASHTFDDWTVISLRVEGHADPCAAFEFNLANGLFREVGTPCRPSDPALARRFKGGP